MKLYTLEEIKETFKSIDLEEAIDTFIEFANPIELPSDEEIEEAGRIEYNLTMEEICRFKDGVEYLTKFINKKK